MSDRKFVFDFGRVVFAWQPEVILRAALPALAHDGPSTAHWVAQFFQSYDGDWCQYDRGAVDEAELVRRIATRTGLTRQEVQRVVDAVPQTLRPLPDTVALLRRLHEAGRTLYYLSNMPAPMASYLQATHAFLGWFRDGVFSSHVGHNKPEPEIFAIAAARFGHDAGDLVFLDDHLPNVEAARRQGWNALPFSTAAQAEADLAAAGWL